MLKYFSFSPRKSLYELSKAAIDESLCDTFLHEKPNKQFNSIFEKRNLTVAVCHFVAAVQGHDNFKT